VAAQRWCARTIQAHIRFGCAHDGVVVFDDVDDGANALTVGWAMAEWFTGVRVSAADLEAVADAPSYRARSLVYP
jgi:hypothetical protein